MDDMLKESLDGFDSLWQRISCRETGQPKPADTYAPEDALLGLIHEETCAGTYAAALAGMFRGDSRTALQRHAAEAGRHLRRLRAEYFIATGVTVGRNEDCRPLGGGLPALRTVLLQAAEMAARYEQAAERTDSPALREVFAAFAADERRRAREMRALIIGRF